jgi:hypothetical protein
MPTKLDRATSYANYAFTAYFLVEIAIRIVGVGPRDFFLGGDTSNW